MIKLTRVRTKAAIPVGFRGAKRLERNKRLLDEFAAGKFEFDSEVWKKAKKQLKAESAGKCAYCEAPTSAVAHGDVEHFRPKSEYWWLAYYYENYTFSCQICNQTFKGDKFPISGAKLSVDSTVAVGLLNPDPLEDHLGMPRAAFASACTAEGAHLPDVYIDDPEDLFAWEVDAVKKTVKVVARKNTARCRDAVAAAEKVLGLNREELCGLRWTLFEELDAFRASLDELDPKKPAAKKVKAQLRIMMEGKGEFTGMVGYFVRDEWKVDLSSR